MKNNRTIKLILLLVLIGSMLGCSSSSSASLTGSGASGDGSGDTATLVNANRDMKTPVPAAKDCPTEAYTFSPMDLQGSQMEKYVGCTLSINATLIEVNSDYVILQDSVGNLQGKHTISCRGSFSSETYSKVGQKLRDLKSGGYNSKFPETRFSGIVKPIEGTSTLGLTGCVMTDYFK